VRHLYGAAAAIIMAAVMFFAGAWGYRRLVTAPAPAGGGSLTQGTPLLALAAVIGTGILAGLLITIPRVSPLAAGLPGLALLGWTALYVASEQRATNLIPLRSHAFGAGWHGLLVSGVLGAVGAVMAFPLVVPSRWRTARRGRHAGPDTTARDAEDFMATVRPDGVTTVGDDTFPQQRAGEPEPAGSDLPSLVGVVIKDAEKARISGAAQALRNTGSFPAATGGPRPATGPFPATASGLPRRTTGSFRAASDPPRRGPGSSRGGSSRPGADSGPRWRRPSFGAGD
jgi:hypothetical protein